MSGWWIIPAEKAKNKHPHRVPLSELAIELLQEIKKLSGDSRWLFPSPRADKPVTGESLDHAIRRSRECFKDINHFSPHDNRRTAATRISEMGFPRLVISKLLNHVDNSVTAIYDRHSYDNEKRHALVAWGNKLKEIIDGSIPASNIIPLKNAV